MAVLGFDFEAGRLDESAHPFSGGVPEDVRLTFDFRRENGQELSGPRVKLATAGASDANPTP